MKKFALALAALIMGTNFAAAQTTVRMATEGAYPPYNFVNDKGEVDGFERDLGDTLCAKAKLTCTWVTNDWDSIIPNLVSGNYDTIMAGMSITAEREKVIAFTQDYIPPTATAYMALSPDANLKGVIAAQTGTVQSAYIADHGGTLLEFATADETVAAVRNGEADAVFADKDFLAPIVAESNGELSFAGKDVIIGRGIGMGLRKSDDELRAKFNKAISGMKADGSLNKMIVKWFGAKAHTF